MGALEELASFVESGSTLAVGESLFVDVLPDTAVVTVALRSTPGLPSEFAYNSDGIPLWEMVGVQVVGRSTAPPSGRTAVDPTAVKTVMDQLHTMFSSVTNEDITIDSMWGALTPAQQPFFLERDDAGRSLYVFNANGWRRPTVSI